MNRTLISRLVIGAFATIAAGSVMAGQIQSSSVSIAREVITTNEQTIDSPAVSYRFAGDVNAQTQTQTFQVQLKLLAGKWASAGTAANIQVTDGVDGTIWTQNAVPGAETYQVVGLGLSADESILFATIQVDLVAGKTLLKQPLISFSTAATKPTIDTLFDVVQAITDCDVAVKQAQVEVSHFTALSSPTAIAVAGINGVPDEHLRGGATNTGTLIVFPTNVLVKWSPSTGNAKVDVAASQQLFSGTTATTWTSFLSTTLTNLGKVELVQNASGYDANLANQYLLAGNVATNADLGLDNKATANQNNGNVEAKSFDVVVTPSDAFAVSSTVTLNDNLNCAGAVLATSGPLTATTAITPVTLSIPSATAQLGFGNAGTGPVYVCYTVPGTTVIPGSSFTARGVLTKADAGVNLNEQNNACSGALFPLGGSVKIDVRNYINSKNTNGWMSVVRLINPDEIRTIDVYGQIIQADGKYGPWGKIATLAPRAVVNMTSAQIDPLLISVPATGTAAIDGDAASIAGSTGDRLRITSPNAATLRVQNYLYNPATTNFLEGSGAQAVDFTGSSDRAPVSEGQYQSQDAHKGLNAQ